MPGRSTDLIGSAVGGARRHGIEKPGHPVSILKRVGKDGSLTNRLILLGATAAPKPRWALPCRKLGWSILAGRRFGLRPNIVGCGLTGAMTLRVSILISTRDKRELGTLFLGQFQRLKDWKDEASGLSPAIQSTDDCSVRRCYPHIVIFCRLHEIVHPVSKPQIH